MLTKKQIEDIIPHRDPFLLIDEIQSLIPTESAIGIKRVNADDFWVKGHFPNRPVMPGVLLVEAIAQVGAVCLLSAPKYQGRIVYFAGIENVKFRKMVVPGDVLNIKVNIDRLRDSFGRGRGVVYVNNEIVCEGIISFAIGT